MPSLQSGELREAQNRGQGLIVSGCLPQRFREELPKLLPEVDAFMGIDQVARKWGRLSGRRSREHRRARLQNSPSEIKNQKLKVKKSNPQIVEKFAELDQRRGHSEHEEHEGIRGTDKFGNTKTVVALSPSAPLMNVNARPVYIPDFATPRFRLTPKHFAYVKIAEGCNHPCSFCIIPRMRGTHRSRQQADIVQEARQLIADGVKELNLISQDSTYYGLDLRPNHSRNIASPEKFNSAAKSLPADAATLASLLRELNALPGDFWIRLLYTHPAHWTDELIRTIAECPKVARYVDMPLQHIHENMLERMRRETSRQYIIDLIAKIRAGVPGIALRTTFIVGFPGETEACFQTLLDFIAGDAFRAPRYFRCIHRSGGNARRQQDGRANPRTAQEKNGARWRWPPNCKWHGRWRNPLWGAS